MKSMRRDEKIETRRDRMVWRDGRNTHALGGVCKAVCLAAGFFCHVLWDA